MRVALHLHSTYSDGELTLLDLREILSAAGCRLACVSDHADAFDERRLAEYVAECERLSDDRFRFVPGLEFGCEQKMHILGYGATALTSASDPQDVIRHIEDHGGLAVIAHPRDAHFSWIESFARLPDGIEVWNSKFDGRYAPRPGTFALLARLQARRPDLRAFYGIDLHWRHQFRELYTELHEASDSRETLLGSLRRGAYAGAFGQLRLPSDGRMDARMLHRFGRANRRAAAVRGLLGGVKRLADRMGARVPPGLKAQLRRIF